MVIGGAIGSHAVGEAEQLSPKALLKPREHLLFHALAKAHEYLESAPPNSVITNTEIRGLLDNFYEDTGLDIKPELFSLLDTSLTNQFVSGKLRLESVKVVLEVIDRLEQQRVREAAAGNRPFVQITPEVRKVVDNVISSLMDLDDCVRKSNEAGSEESALSEVQRQTIIAQAKSIVALLEGPVADRRTLTEFADMLDDAMKEGAKKGISETIRDTLTVTRDQLLGLLDTLSSADLTSWSSLKDIL